MARTERDDESDLGWLKRGRGSEIAVEVDSVVKPGEREGTFSFASDVFSCSRGMRSFSQGAFDSARAMFGVLPFFSCSVLTSKMKPSVAICSSASLCNRRAVAALELDEDGGEPPVVSLTAVLEVEEETARELDGVEAT